MTEKVRVNYNGKTHYLRFLDKRDIMYQRIKKSNAFYELDVLEEVAKRGLGGVYLDLGANIGNHSTFFLNHTKAESVYSVEAHGDIGKVLRENIKHSGYKIIYCAVADVDHKYAYMSNIDYTNVGGTKVIGDISKEGRDEQTLLITLDTICDHNKIENISVIKMDIEGYECKAVRGGLKTIERCKPLIIAELHTEEQYKEFEGLLKPFGYKEKGKFGYSPTYFWEVI